MPFFHDPRLSKLVARLAFLGATAAVLGSAASGCSTGDVKDAGDARPAFECSNDPVLFCNPLPAGQVGCTGSADSADSFQKRLPTDRAFGEGCVANFVRRDIKVEDVCGLAAVCTCVRVDVIPPVDAATSPDAASPQDASATDASTLDAEADASTADAEATDAGPTDATTPPQDAAPTPVADGSAPPPSPGRLVWSCR
ncbi:MAG: hypothetical protein IPK71_25675 [Myxococcales bacterium]|nr:hypothetical protein [Myxococcales bacterium]MBL9110895.1 hypothetical protein [Myxococcales bacterium]